MRDPSVMLAALMVVLATIALGALVVIRLSAAPARIVIVLAALAALIGTLVPILRIVARL